MKYLVASIFLASLSVSAVASAQTKAISMPTSDLTIVTSEKQIPLTVEVADDPDELATGYMFRDGVPDGTGMLFDFGQPREANMYMRNVPFGLDMLFLNEQGTILAVVKLVQPESERRINPGFPVKGVLEIGAGKADELGIRPGDTVKHTIFKPESTE